MNVFITVKMQLLALLFPASQSEESRPLIPIEVGCLITQYFDSFNMAPARTFLLILTGKMLDYYKNIEYSLFNMRRKLYSSKETLEIMGETKQRIQYWVIKGVFLPADNGRGAGTSRKFSFGNLLEIQLIKALTPILSNVDFIKCILDEIRKVEPSFFNFPDKDEQILRYDCILTVLIHTDNAMMVYVHNLKKAAECISKYLPYGFKSFQMDLSVLKQILVIKVQGGDA